MHVQFGKIYICWHMQRKQKEEDSFVKLCYHWWCWYTKYREDKNNHFTVHMFSRIEHIKEESPFFLDNFLWSKVLHLPRLSRNTLSFLSLSILTLEFLPLPFKMFSQAMDLHLNFTMEWHSAALIIILQNFITWKDNKSQSKPKYLGWSVKMYISH